MSVYQSVSPVNADMLDYLLTISTYNQEFLVQGFRQGFKIGHASNVRDTDDIKQFSKTDQDIIACALNPLYLRHPLFPYWLTQYTKGRTLKAHARIRMHLYWANVSWQSVYMFRKIVKPHPPSPINYVTKTNGGNTPKY